jgi:hypothetical protein
MLLIGHHRAEIGGSRQNPMLLLVAATAPYMAQPVRRRARQAVPFLGDVFGSLASIPGVPQQK